MAVKKKTIPGNDYALDKLREVLGSRRAIAFVGAGASAGLYPLWGRLLQILSDAAVDMGRASPTDRKNWMNPAGRPQQVAQSIKRTLGDSVYGGLIYETFRPRIGPDGNRFTPIHRILFDLPFRGFVTTNYDPGLIEGRTAARPDFPVTGYATWRDVDAVERWYSGDIFDRDPCPLLFAHGHHERSETIVLAADEYHAAYDSGAYHMLFERLWGQERLVFVGFGFSDPWLEYLAGRVVGRTAGRAAGEPRHLALIGLRNKDKYTSERRRDFQQQYNAHVYFYRIERREDGSEDHGDLLRVLQSLTQTLPRTPPPASPGEGVSPIREAPPTRNVQRWVHETTNDDRFVGRRDDMNRLDRWAGDDGVRAISVTGLGGLGKTSLVGHWLKNADGASRRPVEGLLFWSFYADRSVGGFLDALLRFATDEFGFEPLKSDEARIEASKSLLRAIPLLIVLDGLEVLQEGPGTEAYGTLLEHDLREFLVAACRSEHRGLVMLTSRFPFRDLTRYLGAGLRSLSLDWLTPEDGSEVLSRSAVGGTDADRQSVSRKLEGHPLALRIFAAALSTQADGDPTRLLQVVYHRASLREEEPLEGKLRRLLEFYEEHLPPHRRALLGLISLFRSPVDERTLRSLARRLPATRDTLGGLSEPVLRRYLRELHQDHLVLREQLGPRRDAYSCHPVLRDHFRGSLVGRDKTVAVGVADLLKGSPASERPQDVREIEPVLSAIELLLEAGNFRRADELYRGRLKEGYIFRWLPAPHEGLLCALGFVADDARRQQCMAQLGWKGQSFYLNAAGLHGSLAGELKLAVAFFEMADSIKEKIAAISNLLYGLHNHAWALTRLGRLANASSCTEHSLILARYLERDDALVNSHACRGLAFAALGDVREAILAFEVADAIQRSTDPDRRGLYSLGAIWWADLLIRIGRHREASVLTKANMEVCRAKGWLDDIARCEWLLGRCAMAEGHPEAVEHLAHAEATMRRGHMLTELPGVLLAQAEIDIGQRAWEDASVRIDEAFEISRLRDMVPTHSDCLVARGRVTLARTMEDDTTRPDMGDMRIRIALDEGQAALELARGSDYPWAERDALLLLSDARSALGEAKESTELSRKAEDLSRWLATTR